MVHRLRFVLALSALWALASPAWAQGRGVESFVTGNPADAAPARLPQTRAVVLMGGGSDVDAAFRWMIDKSGGGDFLVLRASGDGAYDRYIYAMGGLDSVQTLVVKTRAGAADAAVVAAIDGAEAIFIAGGDQADYIRLWKGTPLQAALDAAIARKVPVGGTSAGLAVLGEIDYAAANDSVTSEQALADPYNRNVTLDTGFVTAPGLAGDVTDSHFRQRDRMGRLLTFVARNVQDGLVPLQSAGGVGIDEATALLLEDGAVVGRVGSGAAYALQPLAPPAVCRKRQPLTIRNVAVQRWDAAGSTRYELSVEGGVITSTQPGGRVY